MMKMENRDGDKEEKRKNPENISGNIRNSKLRLLPRFAKGP